MTKPTRITIPLLKSQLDHLRDGLIQMTRVCEHLSLAGEKVANVVKDLEKRIEELENVNGQVSILRN
jgi:hypothetical protein